MIILQNYKTDNLNNLKPEFKWSDFWNNYIYSSNYSAFAEVLVFHLGEKLSEGSSVLISSSEIYASIEKTLPESYLSFFKDHMKRTLSKVYNKFTQEPGSTLFKRNSLKTKWALSEQGEELYKKITHCIIPNFNGNATSLWFESLDLNACRKLAYYVYDANFRKYHQMLPLIPSFDDLFQQYILKCIETDRYTYYLDYLNQKDRIKHHMFGMIFKSYIQDYFRKAYNNPLTYHETKGYGLESRNGDSEASKALQTFEKNISKSYNDSLGLDLDLIKNSKYAKRAFLYEKNKAFSYFERKYGETSLPIIEALFVGQSTTEILSHFENITLKDCNKYRQELLEYLNGICLKYANNLAISNS